MMIGLDRTGIFLISALVVGLIILAATASVGIYNIDELGYLLSADTLHNSGNFVVQNGRKEFASLDLKLWLHVDGPQGMVSQYPVGTAVAALPLIGAFGQNSLIILNLLAGVGSLFTTYALTMRLFASTQVANLTVAHLALCTFWAEYVVGHWPHSVSIFFVLVSCLLFLVSLDRTRFAWHPAVWSGFFVGLGMFFRLEGILLLPGITALTILYAKRPIQVLLGGALGLSPMMLFMALSNKVRFGTFNPLSYGQVGGGTYALNYLVPGIVILICLAGLVIVRQLGEYRYRVALGIVVATILMLAAFFTSPLQSSLLKIFGGIHAILIDATIIQDTRAGGLERLPDGTVLFWGLPKKALVQSMPWLGCLAALAGLASRDRKRSVMFVLVIFVAWSIPFILRSWHGGFGANMRYFLPTIPLLAALSAWVIIEFVKRLQHSEIRVVLYSVVATSLLTVVWLLLNPDWTNRLHQIVSLNLFIAIAALSLTAGFLRRRTPTLFALYAICTGLLLSSVLAVYDYTKAQLHREHAAEYSRAVSTISGRSLFYGIPRWFYPAFGKPEQLVAFKDPQRAELDFDFIEEACRLQYRVFFEHFVIQQVGPLEDRLIDFDWEPGGQVLNLKELAC